VLLPASLLLLLALDGAAQRAVPIEFVTSDGARIDVQGQVVVTSPTDPAFTLKVPVRAGESNALLVPGGTYQFELDSGTHWAGSQLVTIADSPKIRWQAWPMGTIVGRFKREKDESPTELKLVVDEPPDSRSSTIPRGTTFRCEVDAEARWRCRVPATSIDLVLRSTGYVPHYLWNVVIPATKPYDAGTFTLKKGASFVAWLAKESLGAKTRARLYRTVGPNPSEETARLSMPVAEGSFNRRGHLQLVDLPAEALTLEVQSEGHATQWIGPLDIAPARETVLRYAIKLHLPIHLTVQIEPPLDPAGKLWQLTLNRRFTATTPIPIPAVRATANDEGLVDLPGQSPSVFSVTVLDAGGNRRATSEFTLTSESDAHQIVRVETHGVRGEVRLGDEPIAAKLIFGGRSGDVSVLMTSASDGTFSGVLPRSGPWPLSIVTPALQYETQITIEDGEDVRISIPASEVAGRVLDPDGNAVDKADVRVLWGASGSAAAVTNEQGEFRITGVNATENVRIRAQHRISGRRSETIPLQFQTGSKLENVLLHLQNNREIKGKVTSAGTALAGAVVTLQPMRGASTTATTNLDGSFGVSVPVGVRDVVVYVAAPGKSFQAFAFATLPERVDLDIAPIGGDIEIVQPDARWTITQNGVPLLLPHIIPWAQSAGVAGFDVVAPILRFPRMAPGQYTLCAGESRCTSGTLGPGATLRLALD